MTLDPFLRGLLETIIDQTVEEARTTLNMARTLKPLIRNEQDAAFGFSIGVISGRFVSIFTSLGRQPTKEEISEAIKVIKRRANQIKSALLSGP